MEDATFKNQIIYSMLKFFTINKAQWKQKQGVVISYVSVVFQTTITCVGIITKKDQLIFIKERSIQSLSS
jgi:hypothetical protein